MKGLPPHLVVETLDQARGMRRQSMGSETCHSAKPMACRLMRRDQHYAAEPTCSPVLLRSRACRERGPPSGCRRRAAAKCAKTRNRPCVHAGRAVATRSEISRNALKRDARILAAKSVDHCWQHANDDRIGHSHSNFADGRICAPIGLLIWKWLTELCAIWQRPCSCCRSARQPDGRSWSLILRPDPIAYPHRGTSIANALWAHRKLALSRYGGGRVLGLVSVLAARRHTP